MERFLMDEGQEKNQLLQIILALDLISIQFSSLLTIDFFEIQPNCGWRFYESEIGPDARSWRDECVSERACTGQKWDQVGLMEVDCVYLCS